jgi:hypothetical protein
MIRRRARTESSNNTGRKRIRKEIFPEKEKFLNCFLKV